jgi:hypothetical protein
VTSLNKKHYLKLLFLLLIPIAYFLMAFAKETSEVIEINYSRDFYRILSKSQNSINSLFPFSLFEALLILLFFLFLIFLIRTIYIIMKNPKGILTYLIQTILNAIVFVSIIYFSFVALWGLNYHREPLSQQLGFYVHPSSEDELFNLCEKLAAKTNHLRSLVKEDRDGFMTLDTSVDDMLNRTHLGFDIAGKEYVVLKSVGNQRPKALLFSEVLSYLGLGGFYTAHTGEANINQNVPSPSLPFTASHEMAHQIGHAREDEANFVAYLTCKYHPDYDFQYSGAFQALRYAMNALSTSEKYQKISLQLDPKVLGDIRRLYQYWDRYESKVQEVSSSINDGYLKLNSQNEGVKSYGKVVDLLLAEERAEEMKKNP